MLTRTEFNKKNIKILNTVPFWVYWLNFILQKDNSLGGLVYEISIPDFTHFLKVWSGSCQMDWIRKHDQREWLTFNWYIYLFSAWHGEGELVPGLGLLLQLLALSVFLLLTVALLNNFTQIIIKHIFDHDIDIVKNAEPKPKCWSKVAVSRNFCHFFLHEYNITHLGYWWTLNRLKWFCWKIRFRWDIQILSLKNSTPHSFSLLGV